MWVALLFCVHIEDISWFSVGGPINIKKINIFFMLILKKKVDLVWVATETLRKFALLFHIYIRETNRLSLGDPKNIDWEDTHILMIWCGWLYFFMFMFKKEVYLVWVAQETFVKHVYFDDLVWVALLFHAHIEEINLFSVGGPRNIEKINIIWWFGVGGPTLLCWYWRNKLILYGWP